MYFTYVVRPGEAPEGRGPQLEPFWNFLVIFNLRLGMVLQCIGFVGLISCIFVNEIVALSNHASAHVQNFRFDDSGSMMEIPEYEGAKPREANSEYYKVTGEKHYGHEEGVPYVMLLSFLRANPEAIGDAPLFLAQLCCCCFVIGSLMNMAYQTLMEDDSSIKQSRGYRAGTKLLQQASALTTVGWSLTLLSLWAATHYFDDVWMQKRLAAGSTWLLFITGRVIDAIGLLLTASAIFFLETYHSEGVGEMWGWLIASCFTAAAALEIVSLMFLNTAFFEVFDTLYTLVFGAALFLALLWAFAFEPLSHRYDVKLTQSALRNEYYKSRNAMAYYGPAVINADGEIDIAAAAEQAQQCLQC